MLCIFYMWGWKILKKAALAQILNEGPEWTFELEAKLKNLNFGMLSKHVMQQQEQNWDIIEQS